MTHEFLSIAPDRAACARYRRDVKKIVAALLPQFEAFAPGLGGRVRRKALRKARALERSRRNSYAIGRRNYRH